MSNIITHPFIGTLDELVTIEGNGDASHLYTFEQAEWLLENDFPYVTLEYAE